MSRGSSHAAIIFVTIIITIVVAVLAIKFTDLGQAPSAITGAATGVAEVEVLEVVTISLPVDVVNFGQIAVGGVNDTTDNNPYPFVIQNDGTVVADVTIAREASSTPLFSGTDGGDNSSSFQFMAGVEEAPGGNPCYNVNTSVTTWTNVPGTTPIYFVKELTFQTACDTVQVELRIQVPLDEPAGAKSETLVFIGSKST